ncbi:hypothetical protein I533_13950 [Alteromonas mediterranea MED64]|uniref:ATP-binding protein n=1 Tax=Alteromonas mediterranea TaxID=314275 RepID=UPI00035584F9|nr:ATP-binding protein [Alteromonas mediterranea]AGP82750.1 hypothetical protein I533_13950 [Alteromonas mediterranea MED64]
MKVKNSAITYTAYDYQTLQGVKLLADWLNSPARYSRMAFEADENAHDTPAGIDDIVGERPDGIKDFWQVKFTPSPNKDENRLSWDWLLKVSGKTERSRSILKKLYDAVNSVPPECLGNVVLLTNKLSDRAMESCLLDSKIQFSKIDKETKFAITKQLGSDSEAEKFFLKLTVEHSDGDYQVTQREVRFRLSVYDDAGVDRLISRAREWAMFKNNPPTDGWIQLHHVRELLSRKRPEPIPETFFVPDEYCLPDADFHTKIIESITNSNGEVITITGKPGGGKSTYLSFLCQELEKNEIPLVRHHYFLALSDSTIDRLSPRIVAESFLHQISTTHEAVQADTNQPEKLCQALKMCADYYKTQGKPFVVVIDGLDHVWRDNAKEKKPLDEIFKQILPAADNLVVIIGTQPVDDALLPRILLSNSPKDKWRWLPEMSGNAIYEFLKAHVDSERLFLNCHESHRDEELKNSSSTLLQITHGYPLHVIYSTEYLSSNGLPLSQWQVEQLPPCHGGNITHYYNELWQSLNYKQKDVLHLSCGFKFAWPRQAIGKIVKDDHEKAPSVDAVAHLLSESSSGVLPFHESLVVFITTLDDHEERKKALLPSVCDWLRSEAPEHLKDQWLWSCQALNGETSYLREGIKRDWVLDRLSVGIPVNSFVRLLSEAETYAFEDREYSEAYRHRELKTRFTNGPEFQTWDLSSLKMLSAVRANPSTLNEVLSRINEYPPLELSILAVVMWWRGDLETAQRLSRKAVDRYRAKSKLLSSRHSHDDDNETTYLIYAGFLTDSLNYDAIFDENNFSNWPDSYITSFRSACIVKNDLGLLMRAWDSLPSDSHHKEQIELDAIKLSILEDAEIRSWPEYQQFSSQEVSKFLELYSVERFSNINTQIHSSESQPRYKVETSQNYHSWFFSALQTRIIAEGDFSWIPVRADSERTDISVHYDLLNELASNVVFEVLKGNQLTFDKICLLLPHGQLLEGEHWEKRRAEISFKREWIAIAADFHLVTIKRKISADEIKKVVDEDVFRSDWLRLWYKEQNLELITKDAAELLIDNEMLRLDIEIEETIEQSNALLELAEIAFKHDINECFEQCLRKAWDFVIGYGHHKDPTIFDVLNAIEYISHSDCSFALQMLERISPIVFNISKFTDGDETRHSKHSISSLVAKLNPQTAASIYDQELSDGEWYYAEETIQRLIERCDLSTPIAKHIFLTGLPSACYSFLRKEIETEKDGASEIASNIQDLLGIAIFNKPTKEPAKTDEFHEKITLDPADYPPNHYMQLSEDLKGQISSRKFWKSWFLYWVDQGKENDLVNQLLPHIETLTGRYDDRRYLLDLLYKSQRKIAGKAKAFNLLALAHSAMNGWSGWYESSENSIKRLEILAEQYPERIDEFIRLTTKQSDTWKDKFGSLIIPNDKLVFLLSQGKRIDEARQLTEAMVEGLEESVRNINLPTPAWDWGNADSIDEALTKILVSRLKCPVPSIKLWAIEQLASLLINDYPNIELFLQQDLASRKQESECIEVLCVFYVAHSKGYQCPQDLGRFVKARSTLSDLLLRKLIKNPGELGDYSCPFTPTIKITDNNFRFNYFQGSHVPRLYFSRLEYEEKNTGIPFTKYYEQEWINTFGYLPPAETQIDYFLGSDRQRSTGQFYTQASHRGRSAYLRTIELAKQFYGMPDTFAEHLSILALPIDPAYIGLEARKPDWIPEWNNNSVNAEGITNFVNQALAKFDLSNDSRSLLAFSMPIKIDENTWIDLSVVQASTTDDYDEHVRIEERSGCISVGNLLDPEITYEFSSKDKAHCSAMAVTPYPFNRYGHWHSDMESRGLYVPRSNIDDKKVVGSTDEGKFCYFVSDVKIGHSTFWYEDWKPNHPKGIRSVCGSTTEVSKENVKDWYCLLENSTKQTVYYCNAKILSSKESYREFEEQELNLVINHNPPANDK